MTDFLIVGQGIAGSVLAWTLDRRGCSVVIADDPALPSASQVAAGIVNPLTGRKLVKTWKADALFPFLHHFYYEIEGAMQVRFFEPRDIYRPYRSAEEREQYLKRTDDEAIRAYINPISDDGRYTDFIHNPFGGLTIRHAGWVDLKELLRIVKGYFLHKNQYYEGHVEVSDLQVDKQGVEWRGRRFGKVIFCDGAQNRQNPFFETLPHNPVKGEVLTAEVADYPVEAIVNQGVFVLPIRSGLVRIGATYSWDLLDWTPTPDARQVLEQKARKLLRVPFRVVAHDAGIRPATHDRRPLIGLHPTQPAVGVFGGLGTKGVSLAPFWAAAFADYLLEGKDLDPEVNITRWHSL